MPRATPRQRSHSQITFNRFRQSKILPVIEIKSISAIIVGYFGDIAYYLHEEADSMIASSIGRTVFGALLAAVIFGSASARADAVNQGMVVIEHDGITLMGMSVPLGVTYDVSLMGPSEGLDRIRKALALIQEKSPFAAARIETLKKNGPVFIIYDPRYPDARSVH